MIAQVGLAGSGVAMVAVLAVAFAAVFVVALMAFGAGARRQRERRLARMVADRAFAQGTAPRADDVTAAWVPERLAEAADRVARASGVAPAIDRRLERAGVALRAGELLAVSAATALGGAVVGGLLFSSIALAIVVAVAGAAAPSVWVGMLAARRSSKLFAQVPDTLAILASSLRAGHSFFQALDMVSKEIAEPAASEFSRVVTEVRLGRPVDEALTAMADRVGSEDLRWAVLAVNIQREVGGNLAEILDTVAETIREREQVRRQVDVLSAEGRISMWILIALPLLIAGYIAKVNPSYLKLLFTTKPGIVMVFVAACLMALGFTWMRKVVRIDV